MTTITYIHLPRVNGSIRLEYPKTYHTYIHIHKLWTTSQRTNSASDQSYLQTSCTTSQRQHTYNPYSPYNPYIHTHTYTPAHESPNITAKETINTNIQIPQQDSATTKLGYTKTYHTYIHIHTLQPPLSKHTALLTSHYLHTSSVTSQREHTLGIT